MDATSSVIRKISANEFIKFKIDFYKTRPSEDMRLGQEFLNRFFPEVADSQLYYSTNPKVIENIIWQHYIQPIRKGE